MRQRSAVIVVLRRRSLVVIVTRRAIVRRRRKGHAATNTSTSPLRMLFSRVHLSCVASSIRRCMERLRASMINDSGRMIRSTILDNLAPVHYARTHVTNWLVRWLAACGVLGVGGGGLWCVGAASWVAAVRRRRGRLARGARGCAGCGVGRGRRALSGAAVRRRGRGERLRVASRGGVHRRHPPASPKNRSIRRITTRVGLT